MNYTPKQLSEICYFLAEYAAWLLGCGATCIRIEKNVRRMAHAFHVEMSIALMPSYVLVSVWQDSNLEIANHYSAIHKGGINFHIITPPFIHFKFRRLAD